MILEQWPCGCAAYSQPTQGMLEFGVTMCEEHERSNTLPAEALQYFEMEAQQEDP